MLGRIRSFGLIALSSIALAAPAVAKLVGPPWISIEYPVNPHDRTMRSAFLLVHCFHHSEPVECPLTGSAEGIVSGERRSIQLKFTDTDRTGVYALSRQWPSEGVWTLVIRGAATAVVDLGRDGQVASVRVPSRQQDGWTIPIDVSMGEIDQALRARAGGLASRP
jgi:hypothetical protein